MPEMRYSHRLGPGKFLKGDGRKNMATYISIAELKNKIHERIKLLEEQYYAAQNAWRDVKKKRDSLENEILKKQDEWNMAKHRREALLDVIDILNEYGDK
jgi:chromosome segregation ATPase